MSHSKQVVCAFCIFLAIGWAADPGHAQVPQVSYQGQLIKNEAPFTGDASFKFVLFNGADSVWSNDGTSTGGSEPTSFIPLPVHEGIFSVSLGDPGLGMPPLTAEALATSFEVLLRIWVDTGDGFEQLSDAMVTSSAYALHSETAKRAVDSFLVEGELVTSAGVRFPDNTLQTTAATGTGPDNDWVVSGENMYSGLSGNIGIGLSSPSFPLHIAADEFTGFVDPITLFVERSGPANPEIAIKALVDGPSTIAILAEASSNGVAGWFKNDGYIFGISVAAGLLAECGKDDSFGLWGLSNGSNGAGVFGSADGSSGIGVRGNASLFGGQNYGGWFESYSGEGYGLHAETASTSIGIEGPCGVEGEGGTGIRGQSTTTNGNGVVGLADGAFAWAVYGSADNGGYAGFFDGNVQVNGDLNVSGGTKSFLIDHPQDPANKYLAHSCVESDQRVNMYRGNVRLDATGQAWVELPGWFESINADYSYHLTAIGAPAPALHVASEVEGRRFAIGGGEPGMKISWTVSAVRNDDWARANPMIVERDKASHERNYYVTPEPFGFGEERSLARAKSDMSVTGVKGPAPARKAIRSEAEAQGRTYTKPSRK